MILSRLDLHDHLLGGDLLLRRRDETCACGVDDVPLQGPDETYLCAGQSTFPACEPFSQALLQMRYSALLTLSSWFTSSPLFFWLVFHTG